jgi:hypothetical protein
MVTDMILEINDCVTRGIFRERYIKTLLRVAGGMLAHPFFQAVPIKNVWL